MDPKCCYKAGFTGRLVLLAVYTNRGRLNGYAGEETFIDLNVFYGDIEVLEPLETLSI